MTAANEKDAGASTARVRRIASLGRRSFMAGVAAVIAYTSPSSIYADDGSSSANAGDVVEIGMYTQDGEDFFDPVGVHVEPGTTIRFILRRGQHDTVAYHPDNDAPQLRIPEGAEPWRSPMLTERGETFEVTLTEEGVYDYFCAPHEFAGMVGRIVVGDPDASPGAPIEDLVFDNARAAMPSVEDIVDRGVVNHGD